MNAPLWRGSQKRNKARVDFVRNITYVRRLSTKFHQNWYVNVSANDHESKQEEGILLSLLLPF